MAKLYFTRKAQLDLFEIEQYSLQKWGDAQTELYMSELYDAFKQIATQPETGHIRQDRSFPFLMAPALKHFAIYKTVDNGIIIATVLHGKQNIEGILKSIAYKLTKEIEGLEKKIH